ncbi:iron complex outermembrane recepter protein [Sphingomonas guangdongensis]|uniref:Iron complex outermembrane recepter protein n=1 Tax=Sphingomonas guangdongensis TaxID=1141890 RepID=A0A285R2C6_9SPHN|nr:TonB-dependent receptor [Sphingomonas guangdongensis]SOB88253.1 iron complex outermembrane recepter protein [Sphingomonas guangdongensis]
MISRSRTLSKVSLAALVAVLATPASAQSAPSSTQSEPAAPGQTNTDDAQARPPQTAVLPSAEPDQAQDTDPTLGQVSGEDIIVTGTSIRGISAVGSATTAIARDQLAISGRSTAVDLLRELPQVQGLGFDDTPRQAQNGAGNIQRGSTVNLRGLGSNATLLLIDGRRIAPTGNVFSFTEANQIPVSAIERIEVIADGASAIYGSDAVAGVVNYITRKRFNGVEASVRGTSAGGYEQWGASLLVGKTWEGGGIVVAYDHDERGEMRAGESIYLRQDLRRFGGLDNRIRTNQATSGLYGNIIVPRATNNPLFPTAGRFDYYGIPATANGTGITAANLLLNQPNLADVADFTTFLPKAIRNQVSAHLEQDLTDWLTFTAFGFYNRRDSELNSYAQSGLRTIPATSPLYIPGIPGVAPGAPLTVSFSLARDIGGAGLTEIYDVQYQGSASLRAKFGGWTAEAMVNLSRNRNCANCIPAFNNNVDPVALQAALNNGTYNPFSPVPASQDVLARILPSAFDRNRSGLDQYSLRLDGPLFQLPGGELKAAVGAEYLRYDQWRSAIGVRATSDVPLAQADRNIKAAYGELFVPVIGEDMNVPLVRRLLVDAAIRVEDYSDAGSTTNPKIGVTWDVVDGLSLRGAWGTSFRAPNLIENNPAFFSRVALTTITNLSNDPAIGLTNTATNQTNVVSVTGSNADLVPETATNYSFGVDFRPTFLPGFRASVTYYNIDYKDQIIGLQGFQASFLANAVNRALYSAYIVPAIQPAGCVNGNRATYNPAYLDALARPTVANVDESNFCSSRAITYVQNANASSVQQDGIDVVASYQFGVGAHNFTIGGTFTKILGNKTQIVANGPVIDGRDLINYPVSARGRGNLTWNTGPLTVSPAVNYIGPYTNNLPIAVGGVVQPNSRVPSWTTFDLMVAFDFSKLADPAWADGLNVALNIRNITDKDPPVVLSSNGNAAGGTLYAIDTQNANPYGAVATLQITKTF